MHQLLDTRCNKQADPLFIVIKIHLVVQFINGLCQGGSLLRE